MVMSSFSVVCHCFGTPKQWEAPTVSALLRSTEAVAHAH